MRSFSPGAVATIALWKSGPMDGSETGSQAETNACTARVHAKKNENKNKCTLVASK